MGGPCELQVAATDHASTLAALASAESEVRRIEAKYSRYRDDSVLSRINSQAAGQWVECDDETRYLLDVADTLNRQTQGLFDATSGVFRRVWRFDGSREAPTGQELDALLGLVDWGAVEREGSRVRLSRPGMELDFGGFGKEYATDRVAAQWQQQGIAHGLVNLAGDIRVLGNKPDGSPWSLGIQHPRKPNELLAQVPLSAGALATSGDYERCFVDSQGQRHCHILHPKTGRSAYQWQSVSVVAPLALVAGAMSTAAMLMGPEAVDWLRAQPVSFLAVDAHGMFHSSNSSPSPEPAGGP